ncbi:13E12 repeat family protein, partial [Microbacterium sp. Mcb102]|uniref:13E12 repeat family protein n=1 Tax=Microbacterium sp. Mcb102 TaxID=2926012 RepID=UPI0021C5E0B1
MDGTIGVAGLLAAIGPIEQAGSRIGTADRLRADAELAAYARGFAAADTDTDAGADAGADAGGEVGPAATPEDLRLLAQVIVQYLDPDGAEPADDIAMRVRGLTLGRAKDGVIPIRGRLLPEAAGQLQRLFDAYLNPKVDGPPVPGVAFRPTDEMVPETDTSSEGVDGVDADHDVLLSGDPGRMVDTRSRSQKQHDTLAA